MDLIRKYLLSSACWGAPEGAGGTVVEPPAPPPPPAAAEGDGAPAEPPAPEPEPEPAPPPAEHGNKGKPPWFLTRISEETAKRERAEQRAAELEAMLTRSAPSGTEPPATKPAPTQPDFQTAVQREAQALRLYEDTTAVKNAGLSAYPDFNQSLTILNAVGATSDDFVMDVLAVDRAKAHEIFHTLAKDPEKAASLSGMTSRARIAELTRMTMPAAAPAADTKTDTKTTPAPKQVSKAPAPPPPVDPSASKVKDWRADDSSEEEFTRGFNERMKERANLRR